jgi:hypothetical protein
MLRARLPLLFLLGLMFVLACGASQREKTLRASFVGLTAAQEGFVKWDAEHQLELVRVATSKEDGAKALEDYRGSLQADITKGFELAYRTLSTALLIENADTLKRALISAGLVISLVEKLTSD